MPYIITTRTPRLKPRDWIGGAVPGRSTRTAVATLDDARSAIQESYRWYAGHDPHGPLSRAIANLHGSGGTVGPLPDGTVIEVRPVTADAIARELGYRGMADSRGPVDVLAAFNGAQA